MERHDPPPNPSLDPETGILGTGCVTGKLFARTQMSCQEQQPLLLDNQNFILVKTTLTATYGVAK